MQRVPNYGSFLQAYGLKKMLLESGATEVHFIDIKKGKPLKNVGKMNYFQRFWRVAKIFISGGFRTLKLDKQFENRCAEQIRSVYHLLEAEPDVSRHYDLVVIGSDEVFNCAQNSTWGFSTQLYGDVPEADMVISYAASFGYTTIDKIKSLGIEEEMKTALMNLSLISVRDSNSKAIIRELINKTAQSHLDPVLIYGYKEEIERLAVHKPYKYMIVYTYRARIHEQEEVVAITRYAKEHGYKLISIFCRYDWCDEAVIPETPFDVLGWFKGAECIVTDTFHGTIFSIITHRPFRTLLRSNNRQKLTSLLSTLKLSSQSEGTIASALDRTIDYDAVESILENERNNSITYLKYALNG